jgi:hypothetical protein
VPLLTHLLDNFEKYTSKKSTWSLCCWNSRKWWCHGSHMTGAEDKGFVGERSTPLPPARF